MSRKEDSYLCEAKRDCPLFNPSECHLGRKTICPLFGEFDLRNPMRNLKRKNKEKKKERKKIKIKCIDPHVHCRDWEEANKATIKEVCQLAKKQQVLAIFDMPNTKPPIISRKRVEERLGLAKKTGVPVDYFLYVGLTADPQQIAEAVEVIKIEPKVCGLKLYTAISGNLGVIDEGKQKEIYQILAHLSYEGVIAVHCEKESLFKMELWDPKKPWTWSLARPPEAEIESARDQIKFACEAGFKGNLHICHISTPEAVNLILEAKKHLKITCAVTPNHILYTNEEMKKELLGLFYKVNPPLRDKKRVEKLREYLKEGKIDWIETDHAPHTLEEKLGPPYCSGVSSLNCYRNFLSWLNKELGLSWEEIEMLTYHNIVKTFKIKL